MKLNSDHTSQNSGGSSEFPSPAVLDNTSGFLWSEDAPTEVSYPEIGHILAACGDLYRVPTYAGGLLLANKSPRVPPTKVLTPAMLAPVIADRVSVRAFKKGKFIGSRISTGHLDTMLKTELFLRQFRAIDSVTSVPLYQADFTLTKPGYNDGEPGNRVFYAGDAASISDGTDAIMAFLDAMPFASDADRTNALGAALTVMLRNHWPGGKPLINVTANKSHAGKDTIVAFAAGSNRVTSISYQPTNWAFENAFNRAVQHKADTAVLNVENARVEHNGTMIAAAYLERFLTDPEPLLSTSIRGSTTSRRNDLVVSLTTNDGTINNDLMNRSLPIHLHLEGNIEDRHSPIGNPKEEYLPDKRGQIDAELRGIIKRWIEAGCPLDDQVRHPFISWARTVGGILMANGFKHFLDNYGNRKAVDDPLRAALGVLGVCQPGEWLPAARWAMWAESEGLVKQIVPAADRGSERGHQRGIGVILSKHEGESFLAETDGYRIKLRLERGRQRFVGGKVSTRYRFVVIDSEAIPADDDAGVASPS